MIKRCEKDSEKKNDGFGYDNGQKINARMSIVLLFSIVD